MSDTMTAPSLLPGLLLLLTISDQLIGAKNSDETEDRGSHLRHLWLLHMKESLLKGTGPSSSTVRQAVKQQLLYCRAGIGFHLQISADGSVRGVHRPTQYCWLTVFAMKHGVVGIRGVKSGLYLCMSSGGLAYAAEQFDDDCLFEENLLENHYTTYSSVSYPGNYLALSHRGQFRRGNSVGPYHSSTHFLPRRTM